MKSSFICKYWSNCNRSIVSNHTPFIFSSYNIPAKQRHFHYLVYFSRFSQSKSYIFELMDVRYSDNSRPLPANQNTVYTLFSWLWFCNFLWHSSNREFSLNWYWANISSHPPFLSNPLDNLFRSLFFSLLHIRSFKPPKFQLLLLF